MSRRHLPHTADTGIEADSETLSGLIAELAAAMFEVIGPLQPAESGQSVEFSLEAASVEDLVVDTLSELLYLSEAHDLFFTDVQVEASEDPPSVKVKATGLPLSTVETWGPAVKAVTYHGLVVEPRDDGWFGRVYLDV